MLGQDYIASAHYILDMIASRSRLVAAGGAILDWVSGTRTNTIRKIASVIEKWASEVAPVHICRPRYKGIPHNAAITPFSQSIKPDFTLKKIAAETTGEPQEKVKFGDVAELLANIRGEPLRGASQPICAQPLGQPVGDGREETNGLVQSLCTVDWGNPLGGVSCKSHQ